MPPESGPVLVRESLRPGIHSHNEGRFKARPRRPVLPRIRMVLLILGLCGVGYYGYTLADQYVYQAYENWAFDQQIAGRGPFTFADYLRQTPLGSLLGRRTSQPVAPVAGAAESPAGAANAKPVHGSLLGRLSIDRLHLSAMVREGVDAQTLSRAVGHVPTTALAGAVGNFAIAAHRDTLFRALKDIRDGDVVTFEAPGGTYQYRVFHTEIVKPSDVAVLRPDGGLGTPYGSRMLTMITCYPFYYVGSAPKRFIVQAKLDSAPAEPSTAPEPVKHVAPRTPRVSHVRSSIMLHEKKKHGFWHRIFH